MDILTFLSSPKQRFFTFMAFHLLHPDILCLDSVFGFSFYTRDLALCHFQRRGFLCTAVYIMPDQMRPEPANLLKGNKAKKKFTRTWEFLASKRKLITCMLSYLAKLTSTKQFLPASLMCFEPLFFKAYRSSKVHHASKPLWFTFCLIYLLSKQHLVTAEISYSTSPIAPPQYMEDHQIKTVI